MAASELVRVRTKSGVETNVSRVVAENSDDLTILDEPAQVAANRPRPATRKGGRPILPATTVETETKKKSPASGDGSKESK